MVNSNRSHRSTGNASTNLGSRDAPKPPHRGASPAAGIFFGLLGVVSFSLSLPMTGLALQSFPSLFVGAGRAVGAAILAIIVLSATRTAIPTVRQFVRIAIVAAGVVVGFPFFTSYALQHVPSSHGAVIIGLLPAMTAVAAVLRGRERPTRMFWVAAGLGAVSVVGFSAITHEGGAGVSPADLLLVAAVLCAAIGYAEGGLLSREIGSWQTISWALVVALPFMVPLTIVSLDGFTWNVTPQAWLGFGYLTAVSMFLGFFAWYRGLAIGPMTRVSQIQLVQPVLTILWAALFFGEKVDLLVWCAAATVVMWATLAVRARINASAKPR
ncbi:MAG: hypothetical protein RL431_715 [Actinomycetota bacterium]